MHSFVVKSSFKLYQGSWKPITNICNQCLLRLSLQRCFASHISSVSENRQLNEKESEETFSSPLVEFEYQYLCDDANFKEISRNIKNRKGVGDISKVREMFSAIQKSEDSSHQSTLQKALDALAQDIPNNSHPESPIGDETNAKLIKLLGTKREFSFPPKTGVELGQKMGFLRTENAGHTSGHKSYYLIGSLAKLEMALIRYAVNYLCHKGFTLVSVPTIVHPTIVEGCGFKTTGERTQVYKLDAEIYGKACLAGTGEIPLAGYLMNEVLSSNELPKKMCTISRCYRAETSDVENEKGLYRVHQFNKVEMFGVTSDGGGESEQLMQEFVEIQKDMFTELGLHFRILDMPTQELGAPAYRKYDMEAWMPAKQFWGEISSTSNCTDFQSRRLNMKYSNENGELKHVHTVNGTACAVPRMILSILETHQNEDGTVTIPEALQALMGGREQLVKSNATQKMNWMNLKKK